MLRRRGKEGGTEIDGGTEREGERREREREEREREQAAPARRPAPPLPYICSGFYFE